MNRTVKKLLSALALMLVLPAAGFAAADDVIGAWRDTETGGVTSVYSCGAGICIKVVTPGKGREIDAKNKNPALKGRSMAGAVIMEGAEKAGADRWKGKLYNSEDGDTYTGYVISTAKDEVKLEGCIMGGLLCKSHVWKRTQ